MDKPNPYQNSLYVRNLDASVDDVRLRQEFSVFGKVTSARVIMEFGESKGFGFVSFSRHEHARLAMEEMNGHFIASQPVFVSWALRKAERRSLTAERYLTNFNANQNINQTNEAGPSSEQSVSPTTSTQHDEENKEAAPNSPVISEGPVEITTPTGLSNPIYIPRVPNKFTTLCSDSYGQRCPQNENCIKTEAQSYYTQGFPVVGQGYNMDPEQRYPQTKPGFAMVIPSNSDSMPRPCGRSRNLFTRRQLYTDNPMPINMGFSVAEQDTKVAVVSDTEPKLTIESTSMPFPLTEQEMTTNNNDFGKPLTEVDLFNIQEIAKTDIITTTDNDHVPSDIPNGELSFLLPRDILDELEISNLGDHSVDELMDTTKCSNMPMYNIVGRESDYRQGNGRGMAWHCKVPDENTNVFADPLNRNSLYGYGTVYSTRPNFLERPITNQELRNVEDNFLNNSPSFMGAENYIDGNYTITESIPNGYHVPIPPATEQGLGMPTSHFMMSEGNNVSESIPYRDLFHTPMAGQDMIMPTKHDNLNGYFIYPSPSTMPEFQEHGQGVIMTAQTATNLTSQGLSALDEPINGQQVTGAEGIMTSIGNIILPRSTAGLSSNIQVIPLVAQGVVLTGTNRTVAFKFNSNVRNAPKGYCFWQPSQQSQHILNVNVLAAMDSRERKKLLGEKLFPLVQGMYSDIAGKITGMLLELDDAKILHMLDHIGCLRDKVDEAAAVLRKYANFE